jgi:serine/threonine protein phosphatase PrpC
MPSIHLSIACRTDRGLVRKTNEDSFIVAELTGGNLLNPVQPMGRFEVGERGALLAVSDGMGGHKAGEVASALVLESVTRSLAHAPTGTSSDVKVKDAVQDANRVVRDAAQHQGRQGMGATLTALYIQGKAAYVAEVGDSRAYLVRAGAMTQLTHDQNYVQVLLDAGMIAPSQADESPLRHVLLQAMGHEQNLKVELGRLELRNRDCFVLCSDGLTKAVSDEEIRNVVLTSTDLDAACTRLIKMANDRGGEDNVTIVMAGVGGMLPPSNVNESVEKTFQILDSFEPGRGKLARM